MSERVTVEILTFAGCPNAHAARELVERFVADEYVFACRIYRTLAGTTGPGEGWLREALTPARESLVNVTGSK